MHLNWFRSFPDLIYGKSQLVTPNLPSKFPVIGRRRRVFGWVSRKRCATHRSTPPAVRSLCSNGTAFALRVGIALSYVLRHPCCFRRDVLQYMAGRHLVLRTWLMFWYVFLSRYCLVVSHRYLLWKSTKIHPWPLILNIIFRIWIWTDDYFSKFNAIICRFNQNSDYNFLRQITCFIIAEETYNGWILYMHIVHILGD